MGEANGTSNPEKEAVIQQLATAMGGISPVQELYPFLCVVVFVFGLFLGSFFNVCIYRIPLGLSVNSPRRSFCFRCGSQIRWHDNIPVLSYLLLRGKCRQCGAGFSPRYMAVELLTAIVFLAVFMGTNPPGSETLQAATLWYLAFAGLLIVGTFTDLDHWIIPDGVTVGGAIAALVLSVPIGLLDQFPLLIQFGPFPIVREYWDADLYTMMLALSDGPKALDLPAEAHRWWDAPANAAIGAAFGFSLLYSIGVIGKVLFRKDAMGFGDVKLFAMIGAAMGILGSLLTLFLACLFGVVGGAVGMILSAVRENPSSVLQEAPALLEVTEGSSSGDPSPAVSRIEEIARSAPRPRSVHHLPFGPWIALAAIVVLIFHQPLQRFVSQWIF